jgi:hypothetical protein
MPIRVTCECSDEVGHSLDHSLTEAIIASSGYRLAAATDIRVYFTISVVTIALPDGVGVASVVYAVDVHDETTNTSRMLNHRAFLIEIAKVASVGRDLLEPLDKLQVDAMKMEMNTE